MDVSRSLRFAVGALPVNAGTKEDPARIIWQIDERDLRYAQIIGHAIGHSYELKPSVDGEYGRLLPDGNWTGMMGMLLNDLADMSVLLALSEERSRAVNFSYPHDIDQVTFITQKPEILPRTFTFLHPFSKVVWLALILTFFVVSMVFCKVLRGRHKYGDILLNMLRSLLQQSPTIDTVGYAENLLQISWLIGTMLMAYFYAAVLLSFLSFPPRSGIKDISELSKAVAEGTHQCNTYSGSFIPHALVKSEDHSSRLIGQNLLKNQGGQSGILDVLQQKRTVFVGIRNGLDLLRDLYFMSEDNFFSVMGAPAYGKNFCCAKELETAILRATAAGLFRKVLRDSVFIIFFRQLITAKETELERKLSLGDLSGAFAVLISGYLISSFVFLFEIASRKIRVIPR